VEEQYRARNTDHATSLCRTLAGATELPWANGRITCALGWIRTKYVAWYLLQALLSGTRQAGSSSAASSLDA
jgi:hypothetical protein